MIKIVTTEPLIGQTVALTSSNVQEWTDLVNSITDNGVYDLFVEYNGVRYNGNISRYDNNGVGYAVVFDRSVVLPAEVCLHVNIPTAVDSCPNVRINITTDTKLQVVGDDGCPIGWVTVSDILGLITQPTFCDLLGTIPSGSLIASDKVLTTSGGCSIKAVNQSDITCG